MKQGISLQEFASVIQSTKENARDYIAPARAVTMTSWGPTLPNGINVDVGDRVLSLEPTEIMHQQVRTFCDIPAKYYNRVRRSDPGLLAANVNRWLHDADEDRKRMIRTVGPNARAFLSDSYQRIDHWQVAEAILPILQEYPELRFQSLQVTERKMYIKATLPTLRADIARVGDTVEAGIQIENSEVGFARYSIVPMVMVLDCLNGMKHNKYASARTHVGAKSAHEGLLSDTTLRLQDEALMSESRDVVKGLLDGTIFNKIVDEVRETTTREIKGNPAKAVAVLAEQQDFTEAEQGSVLNHLIKGGDLSQWGVINAVTAAAQTVESYDRYDELEAVGAKLVDLSPAQWSEIAEAA